MNKLLTIVISNRDRMDPNNNTTKLWLQSIKNQTTKNFEVIVVDGGSKNLKEIRWFLTLNEITCIYHKIGEKFHRGLLNNVGVRNAKTPYIMASDADMFFAPTFFEEIIANLNPNVWIQSRTMYWKTPLVQKIYKGELNPFKDIDSCKIGRIKKRTTAGGCQCGHIDAWHKVGGYDERYIGWGSEDVDLLERIYRAKFEVKWLGESIESIKLFHQPHDKINGVQDLQDQYSNLVYYKNIKAYKANPNGWGGINNGGI